MRDDPDGRRAASAARHPRDRPARVGARTVGRRRHQRRAHHGERGAAAGGGRSTGTVHFPRCSRSRSSRPLQEGAGRLAKHGGGSGDPEQDRAPLHRADDRGLAQSRRARRDRRLRARSPRRQGLEPLLPGAHGARAVRVGHHPRAVRRGSRLALPDPEEVRPPDAREREVRSALHQDRSGECQRRDRSAPRRMANPTPPRKVRASGTPANRRGRPSWTGLSQIRTYSGGAGGCPAGTHYMGIRPNGDVTPCPYLPVFAGTLRSSSLADLWTSSELFTGIRRRYLARRAVRGVRDERPLRGLPRPGLRDDRRSDGRRPALHPHPREVRRVPASPCPPQPWRRRGLHGRAASGMPGDSRDRVRPRIGDDDRVGRCGRRADEEDPRVRPGDGRQGRRGVLPQERPRPRDRRRARANPRADADAEILRAGGARQLPEGGLAVPEHPRRRRSLPEGVSRPLRPAPRSCPPATSGIPRRSGR